ncbi:hypothetical protein ACHHYP_04125 [Achlya hypogyna]|uniref:Uncharacterized protein n=1 Tax=Achlya hypogyna TaxID=1202772 RepID=A0A1V9Z232_ACHHY|nr:hypothetical protein ACHHYP_04125 [Achlya hypogyna]
MKRSIELLHAGTSTTLTWYDGTSDMMVEQAAKALLRLPEAARLLLRDEQGDVVPFAGCLPHAMYTVLDYSQPAATLSAVNEASEATSSTLSKPPVRPDEAATPAMLSLFRALPGNKRQRTAPISAIIACFIDIFTVPISADDVINFVPNHGPFALHSLYSALVPAEYDTPDATSFYKIASSAVVLDRQRAMRYYAIPPHRTFVLPPTGKGPILRAYLAARRVDALDADARKRLLGLSAALFATAEELLARYHAFLQNFTPISKAAYSKAQSQAGDAQVDQPQATELS